MIFWVDQVPIGRCSVDRPLAFCLPATVRRVLSILLALAAVMGPAHARAEAVAVAAAASVRAPLDEIAAAFRSANPGADVRVSYGASGSLVAQIVNGAPFDLFFSADESYPRRLVEAKVADGVTRYATGRLVLWIALDRPLSPDAGLQVLRDPRLKRIAIANPAHAPYGRAAEESLRAAGLLREVEPRLVRGEDVAQAAQFAESGNADAALIALSIAISPRLARAGRYALVPASLHAPLDHAAVITQHGRGNAAAAAFLRFALGPEGRAILERWGLEAPRR